MVRTTEGQIEARRKLVAALRHLPDEGNPKEFVRVPGDGDFRWNYHTTLVKHDCGSVGCAMGLAVALGLAEHPTITSVGEEAMGLHWETAHDIFYSPSAYGFPPREHWGSRFAVTPDDEEAARWSQVTPGMVADRLEATYLGRT